MNRSVLSVRFRLTLWYVCALALILGAVEAGVYGFARARLHSLDEARLAEEYEMVASLVRNSGGDVYDFYHIRDTVLFKAFLPDNGLYTSLAWEKAPLPELLAGKAPPSSWQAPDGRLYHLRAGSVPEVGFDVVVALDVTMTRESVRGLSIILLSVFPAALLLAVVGGYFLAGRALRPVEAITRKATEITAERLDERLPVANPGDEIGRLATVFNDTLARLESSFDRLRRFTGDASHELRTPLTAIRTVGEVALREQRDAASYREAIGSMLEESDRLARLTGDLLTLARGDTGKARLSPRRIDLTGLVSDAAEELRILAEERSQTLTWGGSAPIEVDADPDSLRRAVLNVLHNAIRYTPTGGAISVAVDRDDGGAPFVEVRDSGPGVPPADREKVFERFYRVEEARSHAEGGSGLGLAIARWAAEANQGRIEFLNPEENGARCRITLPVAST